MNKRLDDLTVAIPTFNSTLKLPMCIASLGYQGVDGLKVLIGDNQSTDGTYEMMEARIKNHVHPNMEIKLVQCGRNPDSTISNICMMRRKLCSMVMTPYMMFLDSDVILAPHSIRPLYEAFLAEKETVGMYGIRYESNVDHVQVGATMWDSMIAKNMTWTSDKSNCECRIAMIQLGRMTPPLGAKYHDDLQARQFKYF